MSEARPRLVIMPFSVEMNVPAYLGSSIAEETIALLTADPFSPAHVLARDSAFSLAARGMTAHQVGEALGPTSCSPEPCVRCLRTSGCVRR